jgi:tetratricopeptide (TPR) repeat protein
MDAAELQQLLNAGIQAIRQGDRARGRELLLQVVQADERIEPAWLWLSGALDDPAEQLIALENVLVLNPAHPQAQAGVRALRQKLGQAEPAPAPAPSPEPAAPPRDAPAEEVAAAAAPMSAEAPAGAPEMAAPEHPAAAPPAAGAARPALSLTADDPEEAPYQCPYCGRPTEPEHTRCPHCRQKLLVRGNWQGGCYQYTLLIVLGLHLQWALLQALAAWLAIVYPNILQMLPFMELVAANVLAVALVRAAVWSVVLLLLLGDQDAAYPAAVAAASLDLAWCVLAFALRLAGLVALAPSAVLAAAVLLIGVGSLLGMSQAQRRLRVALDKNLQGAIMYDERALSYARDGQWALAALHWRRAIALDPYVPAYYKALGEARARLGRVALARRAYESGAYIAPDDPEFARLIQALPAE